MRNRTFKLPAVIDAGSAGEVREALLKLRGANLKLDASDVRRIGGLGLQILLAAGRQWRTDGAKFAIVKPSEAFTDLMRLMGAADQLELSA